MLWEELITLIGGRLAEPTTNEDFFKKREIKEEMALAQMRLSRSLPLLRYSDDDGKSVALTADEMMADLPADVCEIDKVRYEDTRFLNKIDRQPGITNISSSQPDRWWLQGKSRLGVYPPTATASEYVYIYGTRIAPPWAFGLIHDDTGSPTSVKCKNDGTNFIITVTGEQVFSVAQDGTGTAATVTVTAVDIQFAITGVGTSVYTFSGYATTALLMAAINADTGTHGVTATRISTSELDEPTELAILSAYDIYDSSTNILNGAIAASIPLVTYDTITKLVARINARDLDIVATVGSSCPGDRLSSELELVSTGVDCLNHRAHAYFDPELPDEWLLDVILESARAYAAYKDKDNTNGDRHTRLARDGRKALMEEWEDREIAGGNHVIKKVNGSGMDRRYPFNQHNLGIPVR